MTPRTPYRSPFWKPEIERADGRPRWSSAPAPQAAPEPERRPSSASTRTQPSESAAPARSVVYTQSDLTLFGKLITYDGRPQLTETRGAAPPAKLPRPVAADRTARAAARPPSSAPYSSRDATLFQSLEASFSGLRQPMAGRPAAGLTASTRGYSQADLDAFAKLTAFGPPA